MPSSAERSSKVKTLRLNIGLGEVSGDFGNKGTRTDNFLEFFYKEEQKYRKSQTVLLNFLVGRNNIMFIC